MNKDYIIEGNRVILTQNLAPTLFEQHVEEFFERRDYDLLSEAFAKFNRNAKDEGMDFQLKTVAVVIGALVCLTFSLMLIF